MTTRAEPGAIKTERGARVLGIPPPLYYGAGFAAGMAAKAVANPLSIGAPIPTAVAGVAVMIVGLGMTAAGVRAVVRHRTTIVPHRPVRTLLTTGIYRISRNPMYTGLAFAFVSGALVANTWWPVFALPLVLLAVRTIVIGPEERYLAARFGDQFTAYRARTRRWL
jgi:protein-S-isoprenylcysteine O-methyltransferase Ste14